MKSTSSEIQKQTPICDVPDVGLDATEEQVADFLFRERNRWFPSMTPEAAVMPMASMKVDLPEAPGPWTAAVVDSSPNAPIAARPRSSREMTSTAMGTNRRPAGVRLSRPLTRENSGVRSSSSSRRIFRDREGSATCTMLAACESEPPSTTARKYLRARVCTCRYYTAYIGCCIVA
jgi:hypothetical protein